jgi:hypothetical protein
VITDANAQLYPAEHAALVRPLPEGDFLVPFDKAALLAKIAGAPVLRIRHFPIRAFLNFFLLLPAFVPNECEAVHTAFRMCDCNRRGRGHAVMWFRLDCSLRLDMVPYVITGCDSARLPNDLFCICDETQGQTSWVFLM